jgi:DNA-binding transcriptional MerR regulator
MTTKAPLAEYTIRELAERFDVTSRTLRYYEQEGLLAPRRDGAKRLYTEADLARLELIMRGKRVGFSLEEIKEMLDIQLRERGASREGLEKSIERFAERISVLKRQRADIDKSITELSNGKRWLEERLADREPPEDLKRRARAFEALAHARLTQWELGGGE